ncbi:31398_t:CDS:2, partial [Gigaspora margarita]
ELKAPRGLCFNIERSSSQLLGVPATIPAVQYLVVNNDDACTYILSFIDEEEMAMVMCTEEESVIGIVVGNKFSGGAVEEAEKSTKHPIILTTKDRIPITILNLALDIINNNDIEFPMYNEFILNRQFNF